MTRIADRDESFYTIWCLPTGACCFLEFLYEALELRNDLKSYPKAEITFQTLNTGRILEFQHRNLQWTLTDLSNGLFRSLNILGVFLVVWRLRTLLIKCVQVLLKPHVSVSIVAWLSCFLLPVSFSSCLPSLQLI